MSNYFEIPVGDEQDSSTVDFLKREATAELVNTLLDEAEYFADVENWALEHHGFTAENVRGLVDEENGPINFFLAGYAPEWEKIDWEAAARSLNEEFGYAKHSKRVFLRLQAYSVDELNRERHELAFATREYAPGDDLEAFLADVRRQALILIGEKEGENG
jgi:hypothetical protein